MVVRDGSLGHEFAATAAAACSWTPMGCRTRRHRTVWCSAIGTRIENQRDIKLSNVPVHGLRSLVREKFKVCGLTTTVTMCGFFCGTAKLNTWATRERTS